MRDVFSDGLRNDANLLSARKFFEIFLCGPGDGHRVQFIVEVFKGVVSALEGNAAFSDSGEFRFRGGVNRIAAFEIPPPRFAQKLEPGASVGFRLRSSAFPSGSVNLKWASVKKTATPLGCPCITDLS